MELIRLNFDNTYVSIDLDVISANFDRIAAKAGTQVMAVIKADAYGHGAVQVGRLLKDKCSFFGVSSMLEALELTPKKLHLSFKRRPTCTAPWP